jgi:hypothetical protein
MLTHLADIFFEQSNDPSLDKTLRLRLTLRRLYKSVACQSFISLVILANFLINLLVCIVTVKVVEVVTVTVVVVVIVTVGVKVKDIAVVIVIVILVATAIVKVSNKLSKKHDIYSKSNIRRL